ncbi:MAG: carbohydrate porin [Myxococcota bacterium]
MSRSEVSGFLWGRRWARRGLGLLAGAVVADLVLSAPLFAAEMGSTSSSSEGPEPWAKVEIVQISELWTVPHGGEGPAVAYTGLLSAGAVFDLQAAAQLKGASFGISGLFLQGRDISAISVGDAGVVSNIAGEQTLRFFTAWYEQLFFEESVALKLGVLALDDDFIIADSAQLFVNSGFGTIQTLALNIQTPIYPLSGFGLRLKIQGPNGWLGQVGLYDGDGGTELGNRYHPDIALESRGLLTAIAEVSLTRANGQRWALGAVAHLGQLSDYASGQRDRGLGILYGFYEGLPFRLGGSELRSFAHVSLAVPTERAVSIAYADVGAVLSGDLWGRSDDFVGLGVTWTVFGSAYTSAATANGETATRMEWVVEATYALSVFSWLKVQPTLQWVLGAHTTGRDAAVFGLRASLFL